MTKGPLMETAAQRRARARIAAACVRAWGLTDLVDHDRVDPDNPSAVDFSARLEDGDWVHFEVKDRRESPIYPSWFLEDRKLNALLARKRADLFCAIRFVIWMADGIRWCDVSRPRIIALPVEWMNRTAKPRTTRDGRAIDDSDAGRYVPLDWFHPL